MYTIRAAQIDLNRQKEPMAFIESYIDFLADNGYNALVLYIAWRIKTRVHPWPMPEDAYTAAEVRQIVSYARRRDLHTIPTTNLTYCPSLLKYEGMRDYLEKGTRFWGAPRGNFCASNPDALRFIGEYLEELAGLIPSDYLHIGGDEAWDIGFCEICGGSDFNFQKEQKLYRDFILHCRNIVANRLKRRMIMWDDMFEYYPDILADIPTDVIMAHWQYQPDVYCSMSHFGNRKRERTLEKYDKMGFQYLIAPATGTTSNGRSFTEYARGGKNLLGGIMTTWGTHLRFMYKALPVVASLGRHWASDGKTPEPECFESAGRDLFGDDALVTRAVRSYSETEHYGFQHLLSDGYLLNFSLDGLLYAEHAKNALILSIIEDAGVDSPGARILEEIAISLRIENAAFALKKALRDIIRNSQPNAAAKARRVVEQVEGLAAEYAGKWSRWRPGISPNNIELEFERLLPELRRTVERAARRNYLSVVFHLPNGYGATHSTVLIKTDLGQHQVAGGVFKGPRIADSYYERIFFPDSDAPPRSIRLENQGYGGQGLAYACARVGGASYVPVEVSAEGEVTNPLAVLEDDFRHCFLGNSDATTAWRNRAIAESVNAVEIKLKRR